MTLHWVCKDLLPRNEAPNWTPSSEARSKGLKAHRIFSPNYLLDFLQRSHRCEAAVEEITQMIPAGCSSSRSSRYASFLPNCCHLHTSSSINVRKVKFEHFISCKFVVKVLKISIVLKIRFQLCCCSHSSTNMFQVK